MTDPRVAPPRLEALTPDWLTGALCADDPGTTVSGFAIEGGSAGTSVRARLTLEYAGPATTRLPATVFAKSTPTIVTRLANGATGTSAAEAGFYNELRPQLEPGLRIPIGYHSVADPRSFRSLHLLEDLVATQQATFATPTLRPTRAQAEDVVDLLADVHRHFAGRPRPPWLATYPGWWTRALSVADVRKPTLAFLAEPWCPPELAARRDEVWPALVRSIAAHQALPGTVLHSDVHLGNWYVDGDGRLGLLDWQCVCHGHWSLDVAYALVTVLPTPERRDWERGLIERYRERAGVAESSEAAWDLYRGQVAGALLKWAPTLRPPRGFPEMQPRAVAEELLRRIAAAMVDLRAIEA